MIFTVISISILLYGLVDFKKGLMLLTIYQIFGYTTRLISVAGFSLNTTIGVNAGYLVLFLLKRKRYNHRKNFPYKLPFVLVLISYAATCLVAISGIGPELSRSIMRILRDYVLAWMLWNVIETKKDFNFLFKGITWTMFIAAVYGIAEYFMKKNPVLDYKVALSDGTIALYDMSGLRGYRMTSLFEHPLGAGMMFGLFSIFVLLLWMEKSEQIPNRNLALLTCLLGLLCVFLTKMRSGILYTMILATSLLAPKVVKRKKFYYFVIALIVMSPILYLIMNQNINIIFSLFTKEKSSSIGGSSLSMRLEQLGAVRVIMAQSPIAGLGETFRSFISRNSFTDAALGYESVWFEQAVMHGMIGVVSTAVLIYYSVIKIPRYYNSRNASVFALAYWIVYTFSSIPSYRIVFYYLPMFYFIKTSERYKKEIENERGLDGIKK